MADDEQQSDALDNRRAEDLAADQAMVEFLRRDGFCGAHYDAWERELVRTVTGRLITNLQNGSVFKDRRTKGWVAPSTKERLILRRDVHEAESLAGRMTVLSLDKFREKELLGNGWKPEKGATVAEFFYGAAVQRFAQAYRSWVRTQRHLGSLSIEQIRMIFRMEAASETPDTIAAATQLPVKVVSRVLRGDLSTGGEFSFEYEDWDEHTTSTTDHLDYLEQTEAFERMLATIPQKYHEVAILLLHGYRPREIALKLRITSREVTRIKQRIKEALSRAGYGFDQSPEGGDTE